MEYRIYNRINCTLFDMVGHHEPDQTKSLGYILAKSDEAMKMFLSLIQINKKKIAFLTSLKWVVECEERIVLGNVKSKRTDIIIRFYDNKNVIQKMIIIEAKGIKAHANPQKIISQLLSYKKGFNTSHASTHNIMCVTLTNISIVHSILSYNGIYSLTWLEIIRRFHLLAAKSKTKTHEAQLISDFVNYLVNI